MALIDRGSYGHAFALLAFAEEEMGKAFFLLIEFGGFRIPGVVLRGHVSKQTATIAIFNLFDFLLPTLRRRFEEVGLVGDERALVRHAEGLKKDLTSQAERKIELIGRGRFRDRSLVQEKQRHFRRLERLQQRKMDGMYVDITRDQTVTSPSDFRKEEAQEYLRIVERNHRAFLQTFGGVMTPAPDELLRKVRSRLRSVVVAFGPDMKKTISWFGELSKKR